MENLNFVNDQEDTRETLNLRFFFFLYIEIVQMKRMTSREIEGDVEKIGFFFN